MAATRIDCDIHPAVGGTRTTLLPYLDDHWKEQVVSRAIDGLDLNSYPPNMPFSGRADWRPANGQAGQRTRDGAARRVRPARFEPRDLQRGLRRAGGVRSLYGGRLLQGDQRLDRGRMAVEGSAALAPRSWCRCRRRIWRWKKSSGAPATTASSPCWCWRRAKRCSARRHYWPVWQAAEKHKLPVAIHAGSAYRGAPSSIGWPSYRYEYYLAEAQAFQAQILSLIYEGVFGKFPDLKVVLMESGVSWLPAFMWRANKTWRGVRVEVPWVEREPAAIIRDHIRVTMQPFDGPPDAAGVADVIEQIGSDKMFLFASDYPHWQFDGDDPMPPHLPASIVSRMCADNPLETFPRLKLAA